MYKPANSNHFYSDVQGLDTSDNLPLLSLVRVEASINYVLFNVIKGLL